MNPIRFTLGLLVVAACSFAAATADSPASPNPLDIEPGTCVVDSFDTAPDGVVVTVVEYPDGAIVPTTAFLRAPQEGLRFPCSYLPPRHSPSTSA